MPQDGLSIAGCIMAFVSEGCSQFIYCRQGDTTWTTLNSTLELFSSSFAYHKGKFYVVDGSGRVSVCDLNSQIEAKVISSPMVYVGLDWCYLVEMAGELQLVMILSGRIALISLSWI